MVILKKFSSGSFSYCLGMTNVPFTSSPSSHLRLKSPIYEAYHSCQNIWDDTSCYNLIKNLQGRQNFLSKLYLGNRGYPLFFRFLLVAKLVCVRNALRSKLPNLPLASEEGFEQFRLAATVWKMAEQPREYLIWISSSYCNEFCFLKDFLMAFFSRTLCASCASRNMGHWKPHYVAISYQYDEEGFHLSAL